MKLLDLTHLITNDIPVYPGTESPIIEEIMSIDKDGFKETKLSYYSHTGTHIDAPSHLFKDGKSLEEFEINKFYGKGLVVDCSFLEEYSEITIKHIEEDKLRDIDYILFYTKWEEKWKSKDYFKGYPNVSKEVVDILIKYNIKGIGMDSISVERGDTERLEIHEKLLSNEIIIVENLKNLKELLDKEFYISVFPLKIIDGDGSSVRAVAYID